MEVAAVQEFFNYRKLDVKVVGTKTFPLAQLIYLQLGPTISSNKVISLADDLALITKSASLRLYPVPEKGIIVIEKRLPQVKKDLTNLLKYGNVFSSEDKETAFVLGQTIDEKIITAELAELPHLLVAGTTGSGKSVFLNNLIVSMTYRKPPIKFALIDLKGTEFVWMKDNPYLAAPIATTAESAGRLLQLIINEMERRYKNDTKKTPLIVIIDELSELILTSKKETLTKLIRIAQLSRAARVYLVVATQHPSSKILSGELKAVLPARLCFRVAQAINSRIVLDVNGAERLLGNGDALFTGGIFDCIRIQSPYVAC